MSKDRQKVWRRLPRALSLNNSVRKPHKSFDGQLALMLAHHGINCVLDVGANTGQTGVKLRRLGYEGRIVSFEPQREAHKKLLSAARFDPDWVVAPPMALGNEEGEVMLHVARADDLTSPLRPTAAGLTALPNAAAQKTERAVCRRLDALFEEFVPASARVFLKIDTQGCERLVLKGAEGVLGRILGLQMEMSLLPLYEGEPLFHELLPDVLNLGFEVWAILPTTFSRRLVRQLQVDGIFFRPAS